MSIPDTQLGLTADEITLLRHHQQIAAGGSGSSSRAASRASSQGLLLLDGASLAALGRHFDRLMQQIQSRIEALSERAETIGTIGEQQYNSAGNLVAIHDHEIAQFRDILRQIDELEVDFDKIKHIRDILRGFRQRVEELERSTDGVRRESRNSRQRISSMRQDKKGSNSMSTQQINDARRRSKGSHVARDDLIEGKHNQIDSRGQPRGVGPVTHNTVEDKQTPLADHHPANSGIIQFGPATDSGYASATLENFALAQNSQPESQIQSTEDPIWSHSDAGLPSVTNSMSNSSQNLTDLEYDVKTVYSDASIPGLEKESYISELANDLLSKARSEQLDSQMIQKISLSLPKMLRAFALKVGYNAPSQMHRDVMWFVHRHRSEIAKAFENRHAHDEESLPDVESTGLAKIAPEDKISSWRQKLLYPLDTPQVDVLSEQEIQDHFEVSAEHAEEEFSETGIPDLLAYRDFIFKSPAYEWLVACLRREIFLAPAKTNSMEAIREKIVHFLSSTNKTRKVSRKTSSEPYQITFEVDWNPLAFVKEQEYEEQPSKVVEAAVTLTGSANDAQALPCERYLCQTWPSSGEHIIRLVESVVGGGPCHRHTRTLPDNTQLTAWVQGPTFMVEALGTRDSVAEIGEQLAWLGAALRSSPFQSGVAYCTPFISDIRLNDSPKSVVRTQTGIDTLCKIHFTVTDKDELPESSNGQCWHNLFRNPVVVKGFPIPRRAEPDTGLEAPLNLMAGLIRTRRADTFNGRLLIKAFSAMLIPVKRFADTFIWHLLYNKDGSRISYLDNTVPCIENVSVADLVRARHVIGWCSEVKNYAGAADASYNIEKSGLLEPPSGSVLEKITISGGQFITGGASFCLGIRDTPIHISRNGYVPKLKWISKKFIVLWDESDKRGWLINGTSGLLHLVRASLEHDSTDKFKSEFMFKKEDMQEPSEPHQADSAVEILLNSKNKELKIYPEKGDFIRFEDRVDHFYNILEKIIDHQVKVAGQNGVKLKLRARKHLEGWDFMDLATDRDPFYPRVTTLQTVGKGWVDFTRSIHAITLFGRGFGEIIQPANTSNSCPRWAKLPLGGYYLAASVSDLLEIMDVHGNRNANPMKLTENLIWHSPDKIFEPCRCTSRKCEEHSDLVQVLLPSKFRNILPKRNSVQLERPGAVVFGHNTNFKWYWKDTEDPIKGEPLSPSKESGAQFYDSAIGSSLNSSVSQGSRDLTGSSGQQPLRESSSSSQTTPDLGTPESIRPNKEDIQIDTLQGYENGGLAITAEKAPKKWFGGFLHNIVLRRQ